MNAIPLPHINKSTRTSRARPKSNQNIIMKANKQCSMLDHQAYVDNVPPYYSGWLKEHWCTRCWSGKCGTPLWFPLPSDLLIWPWHPFPECFSGNRISCSGLPGFKEVLEFSCRAFGWKFVSTILPLLPRGSLARRAMILPHPAQDKSRELLLKQETDCNYSPASFITKRYQRLLSHELLRLFCQFLSSSHEALGCRTSAACTTSRMSCNLSVSASQIQDLLQSAQQRAQYAPAECAIKKQTHSLALSFTQRPACPIYILPQDKKIE